MRIFGHLKISLLQVLSIGGRKSVHGPPPCTPLFSSVFDFRSTLSGLKLPAVWASFLLSHEVCMPPPPMHTLRFPYFLIKSDHFQALEIIKSEKLLVRGPDSESKTLENKSVQGGGVHTFSRPPRRQDDHIRHASKLTSKMTSKLTTYAT